MIESATPTRRRWNGARLAASLFLALTPLAGCASVRAPEMHVTAARVAEQTGEGAVIVFTIEGANANSVDVPLEEVAYTLELDGRRVFEGRRRVGATIPAEGMRRFDLPAAVAADDVAQLDGARWRIAASLTYLTPGALAEVMFDAGLRRPTTRFAESGEFTPDAQRTQREE